MYKYLQTVLDKTFRGELGCTRSHRSRSLFGSLMHANSGSTRSWGIWLVLGQLLCSTPRAGSWTIPTSLKRQHTLGRICCGRSKAYSVSSFGLLSHTPPYKSKPTYKYKKKKPRQFLSLGIPESAHRAQASFEHADNLHRFAHRHGLEPPALPKRSANFRIRALFSLKFSFDLWNIFWSGLGFWMRLYSSHGYPRTI